MEQDDEEFEQLLGEIPHATSPNPPNEVPRATSAPPHLEELQRAYGSELEDCSFGVREDEVPVQPFVDIRCDEHYENFYRSYSGGKKLPPPMEIRTMYNELPILSPKSASNQLSPFYAGLALDSPRTNQRQQRQLEMLHKQQGALHQQQQNPLQLQREPSPKNQTSVNQHYGNSSQNQMLGDAHTLSSAFGNLSFDDNSVSVVSNRVSQSHSKDNVDNQGLGNGSIDVLGNGHMSNGHGSAVSNGSYAHMEAFGAGSGGFGSGSGVPLESYVSRSPPSLDMFAKESSANMDTLGNGMYSGLDDYSETSAQVFEKMLRQRSPGLDAYSRGVSRDSYGLGGSSHHQQQQQQQQQQRQLDAVAVNAMHAAARVQPPTSGSEFYSASSAQQQFPLDYDVTASFFQAQHVQAQVAAAAAVRVAQAQAQMEEEKQQRQRLIFQRQLTDQQSQLRFLATLQAQVNGTVGSGSYSRKGHSPTRPARNSSTLHHSLPALNAHHNQALLHNQALHQKLRQPQTVPQDEAWSTNIAGGGLVHPEGFCTPSTTNLCRYYAQGYCSRGDVCPFVHSASFGSARGSHSGSGSMKEAARLAALVAQEERVTPAFNPEKILRRTSRANHSMSAATSVPTGSRRKTEVMSNGHVTGHGHGYSNGHHSPVLGNMSSHLTDSLAHSRSVVQDYLESDVSKHLNAVPHHLQQQPKYTKLEEVEGRIYSIAKDQHGCRFLQRKFDEGGPEDVQKIFEEIIGHITELMKDPFGNYLVQKLLEVCNDAQRMEILHVVTMDKELIKISLNMHGTRAVQKLIETLQSPEQVVMVIKALADGVVELIKDLNGNHVVQRCLQKLSSEDSQFIFDAAAEHCVEIATHRHGCCVMQRCVDFASGPQRQRLVAEVAANALVLSQDPYGNYVVQYVLDLKTPWSSTEVMLRLEGNYSYLAMQKYSSNVVEKCLKFGVEEHRARLVRELMNSPRLGQLLQDQYANYVVQSALQVSKGTVYNGLVEAMRPHLPALRNSPYGKRILSRTNLKK